MAAFVERLNAVPPAATPLGSLEFIQRAYALSNDGMLMTLLTFALTLVLELVSLDGVRGIWSKKGGTSLYAQGVLSNLVNNGVVGPPLYEFIAGRYMSESFTTYGRISMVFAIIVGHSIGYYCAHRWMHTRSMYWAHRFHHKFNVFVVPVTANAVSPAEYAIAYMLPFIVGAMILQPDRMSMFLAVGVVSMNNLLIHTPLLADASAKLVPWLFVSTADHLEHHKRLTSHYAAPTLSVDRLLASVFGKPASWDTEFDAAEQVKHRVEAYPVRETRSSKKAM